MADAEDHDEDLFADLSVDRMNLPISPVLTGFLATMVMMCQRSQPSLQPDQLHPSLRLTQTHRNPSLLTALMLTIAT